MLFPTARKLFHCRQDPCIRFRKIYRMSGYTWMYILSLQFNWYFHEPTKDMSKVWNGKRGNFGHLQNLFLFGLQHLPNCQSCLHWRCQWWWLGSPIITFKLMLSNYMTISLKEYIFTKNIVSILYLILIHFNWLLVRENIILIFQKRIKHRYILDQTILQHRHSYFRYSYVWYMT